MTDFTKKIKEEWKIPDNKLFGWSFEKEEFKPEYNISEENVQKMYYILKSFNDNCSLSCKQCSMGAVEHKPCIFGVIKHIIDDIEKGEKSQNG